MLSKIFCEQNLRVLTKGSPRKYNLSVWCSNCCYFFFNSNSFFISFCRAHLIFKSIFVGKFILPRSQKYFNGLYKPILPQFERQIYPDGLQGPVHFVIVIVNLSVITSRNNHQFFTLQKVILNHF